MGKQRDNSISIDWGEMTRNNQYKAPPSVGKQHVSEPKPAHVSRSSTGEFVVKKSSNKEK